MTNNDKKRLVIRIGRLSISFSTASDEQNVSMEIFTMNSSISVAANMREALRTVQLMKQTFSSTLVVVDATTALVPTDSFDEQRKETVYDYTISGRQQSDVLFTVLPDLGSVALYAVSHDLLTVISEHFSNVRIIPVMAPVWHHMHQRSYTGNRHKLFAYFYDRKVAIFSFGLNRFIFMNTFETNNTSNALYYLLSVWQQLHMDAERDELHMAGTLPQEGNLKAEAEKFLRRVYVVNPSAEFNRAPVTQIKNMPYDLIALYVNGI